MKENTYKEKALRLDNILKNKPWCFDMKSDCYIDSDICFGVYTKLLDEKLSNDEKEKMLVIADDICTKAHYSTLLYQAKTIITNIHGNDNVSDMIALTNCCNNLVRNLRKGAFEESYIAALSLEFEIDRNIKIWGKEIITENFHKQH